MANISGAISVHADQLPVALSPAGGIKVDGTSGGQSFGVTSEQLPRELGPSGGVPIEGTPDGLPVGVDGVVDVRSLPSTQATYAAGKLAAASVTSSFVLLVAFTQPARIIAINNGTDQRVVVSFDGTTTHGYVPSFGSIDMPLGGAGRSESRGIWIKHDGIACAMEAVTATVVT